MKAPAFAYAAPSTLEEAYRLLAEDEDAKVIAGGQSLVPLLALRLAAPTTLVDLGRIPGLSDIEHRDGHVRIGAMTTHRQIERSAILAESLPMLPYAASFIAHVQVRTRGTIGGAVAHADPAAEWPAVLLALGGTVEVVGPRGERTVHADDLYVGPFMSSLEPDEIITSVVLPAGGRRTWFGEYHRRKGDYGLAILAMSYATEDSRLRDVRIAVAGSTGTVVRARDAEQALEGLATGQALDAHTATASLAYTEDIHGSADYRHRLTGNLLVRALRSVQEGSTHA